MEQLKNMRDLLHWEISNLYYSFHKQLALLATFEEYAHSPGLNFILNNQSRGVLENISRIDRVFEELNEKPLIESSASTVRSLIAEGLDAVELTTSLYVRDASIISAMQSLYHHDIARLIMARVYAHKLSKHEIDRLLTPSLDQINRNDDELCLFIAGEDYAENPAITFSGNGDNNNTAMCRVRKPSSWPQ